MNSKKKKKMNEMWGKRKVEDGKKECRELQVNVLLAIK